MKTERVCSLRNTPRRPDVTWFNHVVFSGQWQLSSVQSLHAQEEENIT